MSEIHRGDEGAAAVEFAIVSIVVFALVFGMFSGAMAWNSKQALTHAAREGVRFGATLPAPPNGTFADQTAWEGHVADVAIEAAYDALNRDLHPDAYICVAYLPDDGNGRYEKWAPTTEHDFDDALGRSSDSGYCFDDGRDPNEPRVQVLVAHPHEFQFLLGKTDLALKSRALTRHEVSATGSGGS